MHYSIQHCGIVIIAAGESKRLGTPKQLLVYEGKTLINRLIDIVKITGSYPITIVLGANAEKIQSQLTETDLHIVYNSQWEEGMASSISLGVEMATKNFDHLDGIMILVCDQPHINTNNIHSLIELQRQTKLPIAACYYENILGTPALFHQSLFADLMSLKGDIGAKKLIKLREEEVAKLHFNKGILDIDTMEDYKFLLKGA